MAAIELGRDVHGEAQFSPGLLHAVAVGNGPNEIPAEPDESLDLPGQDGLDVSTVFRPFCRGGSKPNCDPSLSSGDELRLFGNADGALTLDIRVPADGRDAGAVASDIALSSSRLTRAATLSSRALLCQTHAVNADHPLGLDIDCAAASRSRCESPLTSSISRQEVACTLASSCANPLVCSRMNPRRARSRPLALARSCGEHMLAKARDRGDVAADSHLQILGADLRLRACHHLRGDSAD